MTQPQDIKAQQATAQASPLEDIDYTIHNESSEELARQARIEDPNCPEDAPKKSLVETARTAKNKVVHAVKRGLKDRMFDSSFPRRYKQLSQQPIKEGKVVFIELMTDHLTDNFKRLYAGAKRRPELDVSVLLLNQHRMRYYKKTMVNFDVIEKIADAQYVFIDNTYPLLSSIDLRPETTLIQTWHGCGAFKRFGYSLKKAAGNTTDERSMAHKGYSYVFVSGPEAIDPYAEAFGMEDCKERILPLGVSRTDTFWDEAYLEAARSRVAHEVPQAAGRKIIMYAPTYRNNVTHARLPEKGLDLRMLKEKLGEEYVLLVKRHPFVKNPVLVPEGYEDFCIDVSDSLSIEDLIITADVCISDYSSLVFEYALFGRQLIFYVPDLDEYYDERGFYYNFDDFACGPICKTTDEVLVVLGTMNDNDRTQLAAFKERFMSGCDGHATERILETVFGSTTPAPTHVQEG